MYRYQATFYVLNNAELRFQFNTSSLDTDEMRRRIRSFSEDQIKDAIPKLGFLTIYICDFKIC